MDNTQLIQNIKELKQQRNAVILAHYYQESIIQDIADFVGDSLVLAQKAMECQQDTIVLAGVSFMAETAKILNPNKTVLLPDHQAGCSLADSCPTEPFANFIKQHHPDYVVTYVNTTAEIKALSDISCTSSNAVQIINALPKDKTIIFGPDRNLGNHIMNVTKRELIVWDGYCHVHEQFSIEKVLNLKKQYPQAKILVHPECPQPMRIIADHIGSTSALLNYSMKDSSDTYIVATEPGILHKMQLASPNKLFLPAPGDDSTCACNNCQFMKMITLPKIYNCLKDLSGEVTLSAELMDKARIPIERMIAMSKELNII